MLSSGLIVVSAKIRGGSSIATLFITDYSEDTRVMFDLAEKRILANRDNIELNEKDITNLITALGYDVKSVAAEFAEKVGKVKVVDSGIPF